MDIKNVVKTHKLPIKDSQFASSHVSMRVKEKMVIVELSAKSSMRIF